VISSLSKALSSSFETQKIVVTTWYILCSWRLIREFVCNLVMATKLHPRCLILYLNEDIGNVYKVEYGLKEAISVTSNKRCLTEIEAIALNISQITPQNT
jgi:hypothetical protein